jgi:hypothetical protein
MMNYPDEVDRCLNILRTVTAEELVLAVGTNMPASMLMKELMFRVAPELGWNKREFGLYLLTVGAACILGDQREQQAQSEFRVDTNPLEALMRKPRG